MCFLLLRWVWHPRLSSTNSWRASIVLRKFFSFYPLFRKQSNPGSLMKAVGPQAMLSGCGKGWWLCPQDCANLLQSDTAAACPALEELQLGMDAGQEHAMHLQMGHQTFLPCCRGEVQGKGSPSLTGHPECPCPRRAAPQLPCRTPQCSQGMQALTASHSLQAGFVCSYFFCFVVCFPSCFKSSFIEILPSVILTSFYWVSCSHAFFMNLKKGLW